MNDTEKSPCFDDWRNITVGKARVIWAPAIMWREIEGWVLPGGLRTQKEFEAQVVAATMDRLMGA